MRAPSDCRRAQVVDQQMAYEPGQVERRIFELWEEGGYFRAEPDDRPPEQRFCMVIPPPNVTGALHLGHALNNTLQDILVRRERMRGKSAFWLVGTDHAGIATQATVEKTIRQSEGKSRHDLGREELVRRIWEWKEKFGGRIIEQLKLMGCSCDYSRERFTLDEGCAKAVRETFFKMFRDGLIYRGKRLVNWDTQLQTAVADDEVYHEEVKGHFYHFKYPIIGEHRRPAGATTHGEHRPLEGEQHRSADDGQHRRPAGANENSAQEHTGGTPMLPDDAQFGRDYVLIATTRPETMLGDTAVAVHPDPAAALEQAEKEAHAKLAEAPEKEKAAIQARVDDIAERRKTLLPTLLKLRDMARAGRKVLLPLVNREIPLVCDEWADPTLGSGCVKITPAHDPNDYEVARRAIVTAEGEIVDSRFVELLLSGNDWPFINVMTPDGRVNENGGPYKGLKFSEARKRVVADLEALGLVEKIEDRLIDLAHSDRSNMPIEPYLSDQWFVRMKDLGAEHAAKVTGLHGSVGLAQMAMDALKRSDFRFHPERYAKTYLDWLSEKRDWCISRQLWWGHRIPVWSGWLELSDETIEDALISSGILEIMTSQTPGVVARIGLYTKEGSGEEADLILCADERIVVLDQKGVQSDISEFLLPTGEYELCISMPVQEAEHEKLLERLGFEQDPDVLDTWFSSALWPHSTLGWPEAGGKDVCGTGLLTGHASEKDRSGDRSHGDSDSLHSDSGSLLSYYYPTNILSTAREIITLWVARMVITGLYNVGEVPFRDVVIHPVIQDGQGRKMSKSLGNGVDPVDIIEKYGADALRFTLADLATETQDIRMPVTQEKLPDGRTINVSPKFEKGRNFCNKLWQAATGYVIPKAADVRIAISSRDKAAGKANGYHTSRLPREMPLFDRWIRTRLSHTIQRVNEHLDRYRFSAMMEVLRSFFWTEFCDWYIEESKARLETGTDAEKNDVKVVLLQALDISLALLHPSIPFITEDIWQQLGAAIPRHHELIWPDDRPVPDKPPALIKTLWPERWEGAEDELCEREVAEKLQPVIRALRDIRTEVNEHLSRSKKAAVRSLPSAIIRADGETAELFRSYGDLVKRLGGCEALSVDAQAAKPPGARSCVIGGIEVYVPVGDLVDLKQVRAAEERKLEELSAAVERVEKQLSNEGFVRRADPAVVEQARQRAAALAAQVAAVRAHLAELG